MIDTPTALPTRWVKPDPMPPAEVAFHQMFRNSANARWKGLVAIVLFVVGYVLIGTVLGAAAIAIDLATGRTSAANVRRGVIELTPVLLLLTNLTNFVAIPLSMLLQWWLWGQPVRWAHSVVGYIRWRLMARTAVVVVPLWLVFMLLPSLFGPRGTFGRESVVLLVIVLLTTPLQAAGEEYGARGLINRAAGSWVADPRWSLVLGTVVSAALFCVAHGAGDPWLIVFYFLFGVGMSLLVWRSGGLEIAWLVHAVHNLTAFLGAILLGQSVNLDRSAGAGSPIILVYLVLIGIVLAVVWRRGRVEEVQRTYRPAVGVDNGSRVVPVSQSA